MTVDASTVMTEPHDSQVATLPPWAVALTGQVTAEHRGTVPAAQVEGLVREELSQFSEAPVREFLPVFVERRVRRRLRPTPAGT